MYKVFKLIICLFICIFMTGCSSLLQDETKLVLTSETIFLNVGDLFIPSVYVKESSGNIVYPNVDTKIIGTHNAVYKVKDKNGHSLEKTLTVIIGMLSSPILELKNEKITLSKSEALEFEYKDYIKSCLGANQEDLKNEVTCSALDLNAKEQDILFRVIQNGISTEKSIRVVIEEEQEESKVDPAPPVVIEPPSVPPEIPNEVPITPPEPPKPNIPSQNLYIKPKGSYLNMQEAFEACQDLGNQSRISFSCTPIETETEFLGYYLQIGN